jgi:hypothetical protein
MQNFLDQKMQQSKDAMIKDFKLKILICFNSLITEYRTPLHQTPHIFPIPFPNWASFWRWKLGGGPHVFFKLQKQRNNVWGFNLLWVLKCSLTGLSTLTTVGMEIALQQVIQLRFMLCSTRVSPFHNWPIFHSWDLVYGSGWTLRWTRDGFYNNTKIKQCSNFRFQLSDMASQCIIIIWNCMYIYLYVRSWSKTLLMNVSNIWMENIMCMCMKFQ